jgi:hypothetical protein
MKDRIFDRQELYKGTKHLHGDLGYTKDGYANDRNLAHSLCPNRCSNI